MFSLIWSGAGCTPAPQDCAKPQVYCAGLVTDYGGVSTGIQHEAWLALQDAEAAGLVDRIDRIETVDTRDRLVNVEAFAALRYDVIVTVGTSIGAATTAAAQQHPELRFIGVEQPQATKIDNLAGLVFHEEQSGYLAGALAAMVTRTGHVAAVCEAQFLDPIRRYCEGFRAGVSTAEPSVAVSVIYRDGSPDKVYQDRAWGAAEAASQVQNGADTVFAAGGDTAIAALDAAAADGALVIGTESDPYSELPTVRPQLLTAAVNNVRAGVLDLLRLARSGQFPGGEYFGETGLSPFHDLESTVPVATRDRIAQLQQALVSGSLHLDIPYDNPLH